MTTPLPSAHEPLPADFLRKYGAQKDMKWRNRHCPEHPFVLFLEPKMLLDALDTTDFEFCAPIGTIAAATTPLPEPRCDCTVQQGSTQFSTPSGHHLSCSIHRPYVHILPHALAALPEKPEELMWACAHVEGMTEDWELMDDDAWKQLIKGEMNHPDQWRQRGHFAYAIPAQSGQGKEEAAAPMPFACLTPEIFKGVVLCNCPDEWTSLTEHHPSCPLSTQPEGGEECAPQQMPATSVAVGHTAEEQVSARSTPSPSSASNAAPANVPPVAGSGQEECMVPITDYPGISLGKCEVDLATGEVTPSPPSTAGETPKTDKEEQKMKSENLHWPTIVRACAFARDLERQLAAAKAEVRRMTDAFHERCRVHGETHRMATEMHALAESLHAKLAAATAERDEAMKRLETIQTT